MNDIPPISSVEQVTSAMSTRTAKSVPETSEPRVDDRVEISDAAQRLSKLGNSSRIRVEKVAEIRRQIQQGTYETPERLEATVDRLVELLRSSDKGLDKMSRTA